MLPGELPATITGLDPVRRRAFRALFRGRRKARGEEKPPNEEKDDGDDEEEGEQGAVGPDAYRCAGYYRS